MSSSSNFPDDKTVTDDQGRPYVRREDRFSPPNIDPRDELINDVLNTDYHPADDPKEPLTTPIEEAAELGQRSLEDIKADYAKRTGNYDELMGQIREGMKIYDVQGREVGKIEYVQFGDPEAVTTEGQEMDVPDTFLDDIAAAFGASPEPKIPEPFHTAAIRLGYLKIDGRGFFNDELYALASMIDRVENGKVFLAVPEEALFREE